MGRAALGGASVAETILAEALAAQSRFASTRRRAKRPIDDRDRIRRASQSGARADRKRRRRGHPLRCTPVGMAELSARRPNWPGPVGLIPDAGRLGPLCLQTLASLVRAGRPEFPPPF